jgi:hypothetical protein
VVILFSHTRKVRFIKLKSCDQRPSGGAMRCDGERLMIYGNERRAGMIVFVVSCSLLAVYD